MEDSGERFVRHAFVIGRPGNMKDDGGLGEERLDDVFVGLFLAFPRKEK